MKKIITFTLVFCLFALSAHAFGRGGIRKSPKEGGFMTSTIAGLLPVADGLAHVSYGYNFRSDLKNNPGQNLAYHDFDMGASFPIPLSDQVFLSFTGNYDIHLFSIKNISGYLPKNTLTLHRLQLPVDLAFGLGDRWVLDLNFTPIMGTDFKSIGGKDFQYNGVVVAGFAITDELAFFFGGGITKDFWSYTPFPILGLTWRPKNSIFNLETILPAYLRVNFEVLPWMTVFAQTDFAGAVWDVEGQGTVPDHLVKFMDLRAGAGMEFKPMRGLKIKLYSGTNPYRKVELRDNANNKLDRTMDLGFFMETALVITDELFIK